MQQPMKVAIIGAGASGLQCAHLLVTQHHWSPADVILLEARSRLGGRVYTTQETRPKLSTTTAISSHSSSTKDLTTPVGTAVHGDQDNSGSSPSSVTFPLDHGAAWVHGTGWEWLTPPVEAPPARPRRNPMMDLLQQATPVQSNVYETHLHPTFAGNPWMRPRTVVYEAQQLAMYVAGRRLTLDQDAPLLEASLQRHADILEEVSVVGDEMFRQGCGLDTVHQSLQETIDHVTQHAPRLTENLAQFSPTEAQTITAMTPFYQHLIECWYGSPASDLQLCEFTSSELYEGSKNDAADTKDDNDDDDDDEEEEEEEKVVFDRDYTDEGDFYGYHCTMRQGMQAVLQPLLRHGIADRIRLNQPVVKVRRTPEGVVLETETGLQIQAETCVVTIPMGTLKEAVQPERAMFEPTLSEAKLEAITHSTMGSYKKIFLTFDRIFWPPKEGMVGMVRSIDVDRVQGPLGNYLLLNNFWARDGIPCIEGVLFGPPAQWAAYKSEKEIQDAMLEFMAEAMNLEYVDLQSYCVDCHATRWEEDPYSRGAYSSMGVGALTRHVEELSRPEWDGRLVFSGEATILGYEGSVYSALFSGEQAAALIQAKLKEGVVASGSSATMAMVEAASDDQDPLFA